MNFDYKEFEKNLLVAVEEYAKAQVVNKDDLYIMSVEYFPEFTTSVSIRANTYSYLKEQVEDEEDYTYYKYCEEEWDWDLYEDLEELSGVLQAQYNEMEEKYGTLICSELSNPHGDWEGKARKKNCMAMITECAGLAAKHAEEYLKNK